MLQQHPVEYTALIPPAGPYHPPVAEVRAYAYGKSKAAMAVFSDPQPALPREAKRHRCSSSFLSKLFLLRLASYRTFSQRQLEPKGVAMTIFFIPSATVPAGEESPGWQPFMSPPMSTPGPCLSC